MKRRDIIISVILMLTTILTGCYDMSAFDQPVDDNPELKAAMYDAAKMLTGKWKQVKQGNGSLHLYDLTFKENQNVTIECYHSFPNKEDAIYKLGYDWKYKDGGRLVGHIRFLGSIIFGVPYVCIFESDNKSIALCPDDGANYVEDPTMYFVKVEDESENNE